MARQRPGRSTTGQAAASQSSGGPPGRASGNSKAAPPGNGGPSGRAQPGGSANRGARPGQGGGGSANGGARPGQPGSNRGARPGQPGQARRRDQGPRGTDTADVRARRPPAPPWLRWTTLILSVAGLGISIYLTIAHYTSTTLALCPAHSFVNCTAVTTSPESTIFGIFPVAVLGLAFYVFMVAINSPWAWRSELPAIRWARLGGVVTGIGFVLYLVYAELIEIGKICEYCTAVHVITFVLFTLIVFDATFRSGTTAVARR